MTSTAPAGADLWLDMIATTLAPELRKQPWATPGEMAQALDRTTIQTPALELVDQLLVKVATGLCERAIISMPPQEGKSERASRRFPLWVLHRNPNLRIGIVSYGHDVAKRWGRRIRDDLRAHPELGLTLSQSSQRQDEFELLGYAGGIVCVGIEGSLTSRPIDLLIIDDPYKDAKQADSKAWKQTVENFWREVALPRLAPGAPVVLIQTRWREDDLAGWLAAEGDDWAVLNIPAQAEHDPEKGETDVLGRAPGEFMESARRRTPADWLKKIREVGSRVWNALYQGRPSPAQGTFFQRDWWQEYTQPQWLEREDGTKVVTGFDDLLASWDMTFKNTEGTDFVVGQVWGRRGIDLYLLDQVRARMNFPETCRAVRELNARWPQLILNVVEDKANGPAVIASLRRSVPGLVPEEPQGGKEARAAAVSPIVEGRNVHLPSPEIAPWVGGFIDEHATFPTGAHDDQVDTSTQAMNRLILQPLLAGRDLGDGTGIVTMDDLDDEIAGFGSYIP
ncbi:phage terminase large subunit [Nocardioides sp. InS609-2]|uniref:phage terminase large subunit n=1 Tax=Nocardioides sp. InS609-2 TaxID=2760705 RepID=UPI0020BD8ADB|nr:phage terminase large subunit [Nocardioides sp. InS609-2]